MLVYYKCKASFNSAQRLLGPRVSLPAVGPESNLADPVYARENPSRWNAQNVICRTHPVPAFACTAARLCPVVVPTAERRFRLKRAFACTVANRRRLWRRE